MSETRHLNYFNYFSEIEETFVRRRGKHLLLSPIDWAMIEGWRETGIPLHVVVGAIESVFDGFDKNPGPRTIKGLMYCREEVEARFAEWQAAQTGKREPDRESSDPAADIETLSIAIEGAAETLETLAGNRSDSRSDDFGRAAGRLRELRRDLTDDAESTDKALADIEKFLDDVLLSKTDSAHLKEVTADVAAQLKTYRKTMTHESYEATARLMILKSLREQTGIPRLGVFYL